MEKLALVIIHVLVVFSFEVFGENEDGFLSEFVDKFPHLPMKNDGKRGITGRMLLEAKGKAYL